MFTSWKWISLPHFLETLWATVHNTQADITRLLIGQPDCKFVIHSRNNTGKGIYKKDNAFSLNTTVICSRKCKLTGYMLHSHHQVSSLSKRKCFKNKYCWFYLGISDITEYFMNSIKTLFKMLSLNHVV
jgi:hypothetical protein